MSSQFDKIAVIGAGLMGAGIAAQIANAGVKVMLFDIVPDGVKDANQLANNAIKAMAKQDPAPLTHPSHAKLISPHNLTDDLPLLSECDWVIEVIIEKLSIKHRLYETILPHLKGDAVLSSNTSTIPRADLIKNMPEELQNRFFITHFFNPPRYMPLLEVVAPPNIEKTLDGQKMKARLYEFMDKGLGKYIIDCYDRPGFIGNRLGIYWIQTAIQTAIDQAVSVEDADAIMSKPLGIPKTGVFALSDLVGLDLMPHVMGSMLENLPKDDDLVKNYKKIDLIDHLLAEGYTGRKGKGGFYRMQKHDDGTKEKQAIDLATGEYRKSQKTNLASANLKPKQIYDLLTHDDAGGQYAKAVMLRVLRYAASLLGEVSDHIDDIDAAMRLGYRWKFGPFELMDMIGLERLIALLKSQGLEVPKALQEASNTGFYTVQDNQIHKFTLDKGMVPLTRPDDVIVLKDVKATNKPLLENGSAALWDIGDGVACLEFTSIMNTIDDQTMDMIQKTVKFIPKNDFNSLVIYNEGSNFSAGANLGQALFAVNIAVWSQMEQNVANGQIAYGKLRYAPFPVVGAPSGLALGGGCEVLLHCDAITAHIESYIGLVEVGVGIIPGWGGCARMLERWQAHKKLPKGPMPAIMKVFEIIAMAHVAKSARLAQDSLFLKSDDEIVMNRERLLYQAKQKSLSLVEGYQPPKPPVYHLAGDAGSLALEMAADGFKRQGLASDHDVLIAKTLAHVLTGGGKDMTEIVNEDDILRLEVEGLMKLIRTRKSQDRLEHIMTKGKPLRN